MKIKKAVLMIICIFVAYTCLMLWSLRVRNNTRLDIVAVNDIVQSLAKDWDNIRNDELPSLDYGMDYVLLDNNYRFIAATREDLYYDINSAIANRYTIVDIRDNDLMLGKLMINNDSNEITDRNQRFVFLLSEIILIILCTFCLVFLFYINKRIFTPFSRLKTFARHVAGGNLDIPLTMDKGNIFGAFSESFDLMREELKKARDNERKADISKKELVASLSHDIKTPISSIMAVAEVMDAKTENEYNKKQLKIISSKAEQINTLITNMFNASLEELQELKVSPTEQSCLMILDLIRDADYNNLVTYMSVSECIVLMDEVRLEQVIDNIISNSYKYAGTNIEVSMNIRGDYLEVGFRDYGPGVEEEELPLIFNKFYRTKNSASKSGSGLGLYISRYLIEQMKGDIEAENTGNGFEIRLKLLIT